MAGLVAKASDWMFSSSRHYKSDMPDSLIDDCEECDNINQTVEISFEETEFFERGNVIGSTFFRWQFYGKMKR